MGVPTALIGAGLAQPGKSAMLKDEKCRNERKATVAEMHEISTFLAADAGGSKMYEGASQLYERLALDFANDGAETQALHRFFQRPR
jgi:uncharacterized membrane-anchored protein